LTYFNYPLTLRFKLIALAPRIIVTDASGQQVAYVHQKVWNLREDIRIFTDESKSHEVFRINADRILDIRAKYSFTDSANGQSLGYVQPAALRSIWRATYYIREDNPWVKVLDALFQEIPFVGLFAGYVLHPAYTAYRGSSREDTSVPTLHLTKQPGFFEGIFTIERVGDVTSQEEMRLLLALILMVQFMRRRG
jgi:hypothetical protein